jgi:lactoylglutathione lyase
MYQSTKKEEVKPMIDHIDAIVLFVQDLTGCTTFYRDTLSLPYQGSDATASTFRLQDRYLILLSPEGATELLGTAPDEIKLDGAARMLLAVEVESVEVAYKELIAKGVQFLRPPTDHPWGRRTAPFADPEGNLWEISQDILAKTEP